MNFQYLLQQRKALLRQARLANVAYAYARLGEFGARVIRARLHGTVILRASDAASDRPWPSLISQTGSQSVIEEHFLDEDIAELADILAFVCDEGRASEITFELEELPSRFQAELRRELEEAGIVPAPPLASPSGDSSSPSHDIPVL